MSLLKQYPRTFTINGKTYGHGPALPCGTGKKGDDICPHCAAVSLEGGCRNFGWECLLVHKTYWVEAPKAETAVRPSSSETCAKCGKRHRSSTFESVKLPDGSVQRWCSACVAGHADLCTHCGELTAADDLAAVAGESKWCSACRASDAVLCTHCNKWEAKGSLVSVIVGTDGAKENWCRRCASEGAVVECAHCHTLTASGLSSTVDEASWCPACVREFASECDICGTWSGALEYSDEDDQYVCPRCLRARTGNAIYSYHGFDRSHRTFYGDAKDGEAVPLYLGFELEAGGATERGCNIASRKVREMDPGEKRCHQEHDGSIPGYGFELISEPHTLDAHKAFDWAARLKVMVANGMRSHDLNGKCGLHVHVSRNFLSEKDCVNLDLFVLKHKVFWERVARRSESHYARYVEKAELSAYGHSRERYCAVNFMPSKTVEFRLFRGTLNPNTLMATLEVVDAVCRWIKTRTSDDMCKNKDEVERFMAWMAAQGDTYARATAYAVQRRAISDPNAGSPDASNPEL